MADPKLNHLKRVPIFSQCSRSELECLARNTDEVTLPAGRTLIVQGESNHTFFILIDGEAEVTIDGQSMGRVRKGDIIGEISMLDRGPAIATVRTVSPIEALVMSHAQFRDSIKADQAIALKVIAVMADRLRSSSLASM